MLKLPDKPVLFDIYEACCFCSYLVITCNGILFIYGKSLMTHFFVCLVGTPEQDKCVEMFNSYNSKLKVPFQENGLHSACEVGDLKMTESLLTNKGDVFDILYIFINIFGLIIAFITLTWSPIGQGLTKENITFYTCRNTESSLVKRQITTHKLEHTNWIVFSFITCRKGPRWQSGNTLASHL